MCEVICSTNLSLENSKHVDDIPKTTFFLNSAPERHEVVNPCVPNPCGNFAQCNDVGGSAVCRCLPNYYGSAPFCRPECTVNSDCPNTKACVNERCIDPCSGSCGLNSVCNVINHVPNCDCKFGFEGDAFVRCHPVVIARKECLEMINLSNDETMSKILDDEPPVVKDKCRPNPCGSNAACNEGVCSCISDYIGNPYVSCHPACVLNTECPRNKACVRNKCTDPCVGICGREALCSVVNHIPMCDCPFGYTGNAYTACAKIESRQLSKLGNFEKKPQRLNFTELPPAHDYCNPSPCGQNSHCSHVNNQVVCSCLPGYYGTAPACRRECAINSDCVNTKACVNERCIDPCPGSCALNAECKAINHKAACYCLPRYTGDPFVRCSPMAIGKLNSLFCATSSCQLEFKSETKGFPYLNSLTK